MDDAEKLLRPCLGGQNGDVLGPNDPETEHTAELLDALYETSDPGLSSPRRPPCRDGVESDEGRLLGVRGFSRDWPKRQRGGVPMPAANSAAPAWRVGRVWSRTPALVAPRLRKCLSCIRIDSRCQLAKSWKIFAADFARVREVSNRGER